MTYCDYPGCTLPVEFWSNGRLHGVCGNHAALEGLAGNDIGYRIELERAKRNCSPIPQKIINGLRGFS